MNDYEKSFSDLTHTQKIKIKSLQSQLDDQFALRDIIDSKIKDLNKKKDIMMGLYSEDVEKSNNKFLQLSYHKKFVIRNSFLTDLLEISHFKAIYHFSIVIVIFACLFIFQDKINYTFIRFLVNEYTIFNVIKVSAVMQVFTTIFIYHGLKFWLMSRSKNSNPDYYDYFWLITYVLYLILHMTLLPMYLSVHYFGMFKMLMFIYMILLAIKMHAFVRENLYKGFLNFDQDRKLCDLKHFIYFLMIPTLIYQDNYPRLKCINWISVIKETIQVLIGLILVNYLYFYYIYNNMHNYVYHKSHSLSYLLGKNFVPSCAILFMGFYVHQHAFLNLIAELTLFGDKLFYKDWWVSKSYSRWYRTWNTVIHDWIFQYLYVDVQRMTKSKTLALVIVLNISSLIHEYIIALTFGFFVPILMISYSFFGAIMAILPELRYGNIMVLGSFMFGINFFLTFYSLEYIQREKMIGLYDGYLNYIVPYIVH